ncbi:hypothetical protein ACHAQK_009880 [Fusarium lateritium]
MARPFYNRGRQAPIAESPELPKSRSQDDSLSGGAIQFRPRASPNSNLSTTNDGEVTSRTIVTNIVKLYLGPCERDKIDISPDVDTISKDDVATIRQQTVATNHVTKLLIEVSKSRADEIGGDTTEAVVSPSYRWTSESQDDKIGDGTTGVMLAGALLKQAADVIEKGIHPTPGQDADILDNIIPEEDDEPDDLDDLDDIEEEDDNRRQRPKEKEIIREKAAVDFQERENQRIQEQEARRMPTFTMDPQQMEITNHVAKLLVELLKTQRRDW